MAQKDWTPNDLIALNAERSAGDKRKGAELFGKLMAQDMELVRRGWKPITDWWKETLHDFYHSGAMRFVGRVGRKGIKSSTFCRVAVNEVRCGAHQLGPGDLGLFMFLSENVTEATNRIFTIKAILDTLREQYEPLGKDLRLKGRPLLFGVRAARIGAVSGPIVIGFVGDEVAKWKDEDTGANPATEVLRSVRPAMVNQPNAHEFLISSPWSELDAHYEHFEMGNTEHQRVAQAPTWEANPEISEARTKEMEPDVPTWTREYKAVPMGSGTQHWFDAGMVREATRKALVLPSFGPPGAVVNAGGDFAFISDHAALAITNRFGEWEKARYQVAELFRLAPTTGPLKPGFVCKEFAARLKAHGCSGVMADGHYRMSIIEHLDEEQLLLLAAPAEVVQPYVRFRVLLHGQRFELPEDKTLAEQLKSVMWRPTPNGNISIILPRKAGQGHCDLVSALVLAPFQHDGDVVPEQPSHLTYVEHEARRAIEEEDREEAEMRREKARPQWGNQDDDGWEIGT